MPMAGHALPVTGEYQPADSIPAETRTLASTLAAAWRLVYQPALADRTRTEVDRPIRRAYARAGHPQPEVTIIDLRALYRPAGPEHEAKSEPSRCSHRWVVVGHWCNQPHGPGRELRDEDLDTRARQGPRRGPASGPRARQRLAPLNRE